MVVEANVQVATTPGIENETTGFVGLEAVAQASVYTEIDCVRIVAVEADAKIIVVTGTVTKAMGFMALEAVA